MIYCMADLHGDMEKYQEILRTIQFSDEDYMYVIGDVIDRGSQGVDILLDIMRRSNMLLLRGNHEQMCIDNLLIRDGETRDRWQRNGGSITRQDLLYKRTRQEKEQILRFLRKTPLFIDLEVGGKKYHLVHGFPADTDHDRVWGRPEANTPRPLQNTTAIIGHTPTMFLTGDENAPMQIFHGDGWIDIDCGCACESSIRRLGCLRLNDMREFYA